MWILTTHLDLLLYRLMHTVSLQSLNFYDPNHHYPNPWCRTGYEVLLSCLKQDFEKDHNKQQLTSSSLFVIDTRFDRLAWNCQHNAEYHIFILAIVLSLNQACSGHNGMSCPLSVWFWFIFFAHIFFSLFLSFFDDFYFCLSFTPFDVYGERKVLLMYAYCPFFVFVSNLSFGIFHVAVLGGECARTGLCIIGQYLSSPISSSFPLIPL